MDLFENWLANLLTPKELRDLQKRFRILQLLKTKLNYREISRQMKISTTTVVRLNQRLKIRKLKRKKSNINGYKKKNLPWKFG